MLTEFVSGPISVTLEGIVVQPIRTVAAAKHIIPIRMVAFPRGKSVAMNTSYATLKTYYGQTIVRFA